MENFSEFLRSLGIEEGEVKPFVPPAIMPVPGLDLLVYAVEDCSHTAEHIPGADMDILWSNTDPPRIIGVQIWHLSKIKKAIAEE